MNNRDAFITLNVMERVGPVRVRAMIEHLGSVQAIFEATAEQLGEVKGIGPSVAKSIINQRRNISVENELKIAAKYDVRIITQEDAEYPERLKVIHDPPLALYVLGKMIPEDKHAIAMVGSRRCSHYGIQIADRLAYQLGNAGFCVVSGLARGIDTAAHQGALKSDGRTIAVLGSAIDQLYPKENTDLARQIVKYGAVISEFPFGTTPSRTTFPMRNRIVTGMSMGILVVEASRQSGAMISVDEATSQGRQVFAVPGRIDNPGASGCHMLIKQGAKLVEDVRDITEEFEFLQLKSNVPSTQAENMETLPAGETMPAPKLTEAESQLLEALGQGAMDVDSLIRAAGLDPARVSGLLIGLEMKRLVRMLPGRIVERV